MLDVSKRTRETHRLREFDVRKGGSHEYIRPTLRHYDTPFNVALLISMLCMSSFQDFTNDLVPSS